MGHPFGRATDWYSIYQQMPDNKEAMDCDTLHEAMKSIKTATQVKLEEEFMATAYSPQDVYEQRRLKSGCWQKQYRPETDSAVWTLDRRKLEEELRNIYADRGKAENFTQNPEKFVDSYFGPGSWKTYTARAKGDKVAYYEPERYRYEKMRLEEMYRDPCPKKKKVAKKKPIAKVVSPHTGISASPEKLRARPPGHERIRSKGEGLLAELQASFDRWVAPPIKIDNSNALTFTTGTSSSFIITGTSA